MLRVFVDTSVLFTAVYSSTGAARDLIRLALRGKVKLLVSQDVLDEVERNLAKKVPQVIPVYHVFLATLALELIPLPSRAAVHEAEAYVAAKDAMIIAAAILAQPDYLVTYDRKHLLDRPEVAARSGLVIVTPDAVVQAVHNAEDTPDD